MAANLIVKLLRPLVLMALCISLFLYLARNFDEILSVLAPVSGLAGPIVVPIFHFISWFLVDLGIFRIYCYLGVMVIIGFIIHEWVENREVNEHGQGDGLLQPHDHQLYDEIQEETHETIQADLQAYKEKDIKTKFSEVLPPQAYRDYQKLCRSKKNN